jgi:nucleotide-binding universal stress UspA family protein
MLVALDGSRHAEAALPPAEALMRRAGAAATLVTVADGVRGMRDARARLEVVAESVRASGYVDIAVLEGRPAPKVVEFAVRSGIDLVVVCSRGGGGLRRLALGSVAEEILRLSPVPVLVARPREDWTGPVEPRRILVPLDGSIRAASAVPDAADVAQLFGARVVLLTVAPPPSDADELSGVAAQAGLPGVRRVLETRGVECEVLARLGDPADEIVDAARTLDVDLVAMATHGRTGLDRVFFGSVTESVLRRTRCPLLVRRTASILVEPPVSRASHLE